MVPPFPLSDKEVQCFVEQALAEDLGPGDITAQATIPEGATLSAEMNARQEMVLCGLSLAQAFFRALDPEVTLEPRAQDGAVIAPEQAILGLSGRARGMLSAERSALNIVQHLSGIASLTKRYVDAIAGTGAVLLDTRKTIPGLRKLAKYAVACGGGQNHRFGLHDAVMIKDNHIAAAGGVTAAVHAALAAGLSDIQVECDTLGQVSEALSAGAHRLLLDNMATEMLRQAVALVDGRAKLEASGGITLRTIREIAETGVDAISVGRLTQSAPACDIGLDYSFNSV